VWPAISSARSTDRFAGARFRFLDISRTPTSLFLLIFLSPFCLRRTHKSANLIDRAIGPTTCPPKWTTRRIAPETARCPTFLPLADLTLCRRDSEGKPRLTLVDRIVTCRALCYSPEGFSITMLSAEGTVGLLTIVTCFLVNHCGSSCIGKSVLSEYDQSKSRFVDVFLSVT